MAAAEVDGAVKELVSEVTLHCPRCGVGFKRLLRHMEQSHDRESAWDDYARSVYRLYFLQ